jgi:predicted dehydrogenase
MNDPPITLAVVGCGAVAAHHYLPSLAACPAFSTTLLVDRDLERARSLAGRWGVAATAADYHDVPARAQAAVIALPHHLHAPVAIDLLRAGVHVLVEKPMAISVADCDGMLAAARDADRRLAVGLQFRFFDPNRLVRRFLERDLLGPLRRFDLRLGVISRWPFASDFVLRRETAGGGVLVDYGVHLLDLLLFWLGDLELRAYRHDAEGGVESDCELEVATLAGVPGLVEVSRTRNLRNTCVLEGERLTLEAGVWDPDATVELRPTGGDPADRGALELAGRARRQGSNDGLDFNGAFLRSLEDFAAAIAGHREPALSGVEGRRAVALIEACYARAEPLVLPWARPARLQAAP